MEPTETPTPTTPAIATGRTEAPKRKRTAPRQQATATEAVGSAPAKGDPTEKLVVITLHDSKEIPPGGQFVAVNGRQFWLKPGVKYRVPRYVVDALNNAVKGEPDIDDKMRVVGVRDAPRLPFTIHLDE